VSSLQSRRACSISSWVRPIQFQNIANHARISAGQRRSGPRRSANCQHRSRRS
jgi:hypothetical protein